MAAGIAERVSERTAAAAVGVICPSSVADNVVINARWTGRVLVSALRLGLAASRDAGHDGPRLVPPSFTATAAARAKKPTSRHS
jgi:hypothetical protein